ncbi:DUF3572 family protein [Oceanicella actignis]|uniref:DUF3572 domain-containing protein n=1 Tax=Oceanicella actignis TaxID=1189325 RepID=A0A1M7TYC3_9RHOB|nr:DUF3572 family protein [Oceanicella actignis]TYO89671.1 uncharacterized protein DUF3572 [Oceanicella actignis]SET81751.1 Protein of unknown function [Oceanicella actignis]SHN75741.1 Protein of unknown function [Oceanicella actignis]
MNRDAAEALALEALAWMASDPDRLGAFLAAAGADADTVRARAADPEFLGFVLDILLGDEGAVIAFCDAAGRPYDAPLRARAALPGGDLPHWT